MTEDAQVAADQRELPKLKHPEPDVSPEQPWQDDALDRAKVAERLTNLIRNQRDPFVISIDGHWGTGKTFLLKRWQKDLENKGFRVIYFNAWEDDFCDAPLLSIIGQLSEYFEEGKLKSFAEEAARIAVPLLVKNVSSVTNRFTGLTLDVNHNGRDLLREYREQRKTKTDLKEKLAKMSDAVVEATERPLVFIIDELDRCRPTFAIELLERVKHIFDVPDMVFVFGINRDELCNSLNSVYGEIDASIYLRRFFDMEFTLPEVDSERFCRSLMDRFHFEEFFRTLSTNASTKLHSNDYNGLSHCFPVLCGSLGLSLRDIDYCIRLISLTCRNLEEHFQIYPRLLSLLIPLKLENPTLYRKLIHGECHASDIINHLYEVNSGPIEDGRFANVLDAIEADLYCMEGQPRSGDRRASASALCQLKLLQEGSELTHPEFLSERIRKSDSGRVEKMLSRIEAERNVNTPGDMLTYLARFIDLHDFVRR